MDNMQFEIPNKSLFKIDEVCGFTGVKPYVLRFWESEFPEISPITSASGQKLYEHKDIEAVAFIKKLLFDEKLSIEKARLKMLETTKEREAKAALAAADGSGPQAAGENIFRRTLSDKDLEKLLTAKDRLRELVKILDTFQERHNWV